MVRIDVRYEGGLHCQAVHAPSGAAVATDAPVDNHGRGESFSPTDLVATALATCMVTVMGIVADRHGWDIAGSTLTVGKEMTTDGPRRIRRLTVDVDVAGDHEEYARLALTNAANTCPVRLSLLEAIEVPVTFHWALPPA